jgi:hypothetical protein
VTDAHGFDPLQLFRTLARFQVAYVVIGGVAGTLYGSPTVTGDLDICYERSRPNLLALAATLSDLRSTLRGVDPSLPFQLDVRTLMLGDSFTFSTDAGDFDCLGTPAGTAGYPDLVKQAVEYEVDDVVIKVVSLDDLIRMKKAAGRPKDRIELEILGAVRDEIDRDKS